MSTPAADIGTLHRTPTGFEGRLTRQFDHGTDAVWRMLTEPQAMAQWLAPGSIEPRAGGAVRIDFADSGTVIDSLVTAFEAQRLLAYSWSSGSEPERPMRWELAPAGAGSTLTLTLQIPAHEDAAKACAGFEGHLDMLEAALEGVPIKFPFQRFLAARSAYGAQLAG
ncbi:SRPBCC family protein [Alicycliphilus denitrificans]|uniref:SRPBCC family protein n=1 Tax=Alicycliphilus denitrificans TaxID=179636 RepID=UPI00384CA6CF